MAQKKTLVLESLYDPAACGITSTVDLILIHGLNGDYLKTWTHETTNVCWPKDLLPAAFPHMRVLSLAYDADVYGNTSVAGIRENAQTLLARLRDRRQTRDHGKPIVFVAHSLGGIVLKKALCIARNDTRYQHLFSATTGFLLYGTPHFGADQSRWLAMAKSFAPVMRRRFGWMGRHSELVDSLTRNSPDIANLCEDFRFLARRFAIVSFYETRMWPGTREPIVDMTSAVLFLEHEVLVPLDVDHMNLCRFRDADDQSFKSTCSHISWVAKGLGHGLDKRVIVQVRSGDRIVELEQY